MSASTLYDYFKEVTGMSPIQYQKQIRLQAARRLLLTETAEAAEAAFQVGYESPSHFSREYASVACAIPCLRSDSFKILASLEYTQSRITLWGYGCFTATPLFLIM
ncbi:helix-turn-helix domain-containing protein [Paenibacillus sp. MAH-36]|uniref:AraC family transcriptional regulator n=1 Tax=Paenibacillus violae TaxID=3077234 RepID=A0ABU3RDH4_9BACL|nr:AraC family transcriptional regulator [Paenibacillus sp. PFR10]MDU0202128.1 AraC family transcriptional regulator [Paenibacillus sp. PFR10]